MMVGKRQSLSDKSYLLRATGLRHSYGSGLALRDLDLSLHPGEVVCLLGASGSGKSTALRVLAGLERPEGGEIIFNDRVLCGDGVWVAPEGRRMGLVFQDFALFPHLSVFENISYGLASNLGRDEVIERVGSLLDAVSLRGFGDYYPHNLSGGQQQRVALARSLAPRPHLILMDEPFSGLDARLKDSVRDWTLHILKDNNIGAVIVTHDSEEALYMADRITVMDSGYSLQSGSPEELYLRPVNIFVAEFFGQVNKMRGVVRGGCVGTPFGAYECVGVGDGVGVTVLFRPEHLSLVVSEIDLGIDFGGIDLGFGRALALVEASRMLGRSSLVHLQVWDGGGFGLHMHGRVSGNFTPVEGSLLELELDFGEVLLFEDDEE